jgi:hypothetical protein
MIWLLDRGGEKLTYEICRDDNGRGYMLVLTEPNGQTRVERITQPTILIERSVDQMRKLRDAGWKVG